MYTLEKMATGADRARKRIHTAGEALVPAFDGKLVRVQTARNATVNALVRKGWRVVQDAPAPAPMPAKAEAPPVPAPAPQVNAAVPERMRELKDMTVKQLRSLARDLSIRGRSSMSEDELIDAIMEAEA